MYKQRCDGWILKANVHHDLIIYRLFLASYLSDSHWTLKSATTDVELIVSVSTCRHSASGDSSVTCWFPRKFTIASRQHFKVLDKHLGAAVSCISINLINKNYATIERLSSGCTHKRSMPASMGLFSPANKFHCALHAPRISSIHQSRALLAMPESSAGSSRVHSPTSGLPR